MLTKNLLKPDYNKKSIILNHITSKLLIPFGIGAVYINSNIDNKKIIYATNQILVSTVGIHSYISTSNIITDYVKPNILNKSIRVTSLGLHSLAFLGYSYYFIKNVIDKKI